MLTDDQYEKARKKLGISKDAIKEARPRYLFLRGIPEKIKYFWGKIDEFDDETLKNQVAQLYDYLAYSWRHYCYETQKTVLFDTKLSFMRLKVSEKDKEKYEKFVAEVLNYGEKIINGCEKE